MAGNAESLPIAFVSPHSDPLAEPGEPDAGGQCVYERKLAATLAAAGHSVRAYTRRWGDKAAHRVIRERAEVLRIAAGGGAFVRKEDMAPVLPDFVGGMWQRDGPWLDQAAVFHGHYWDGGAAALMASLRSSRPLIFTSHSLGREKRDRVPEDGSLNYALRIANEHRIMAAADRVIALTEMEKGVLGERYGVPPEKVAVVPAGVDTATYRPRADGGRVRAELGLAEDELLVFTTGRLDPRKGYDLLLQALPRVKAALAERGQRARFLLPRGGEAPNANEAEVRRQMERLIAEHDLGDTVTLFPHLAFDELLAYYSASDLFVLPSPYEPFGLVAVEAMACETAVLATPHGGPPEIIDPGEDGELADPHDAEAFGDALIRLLSDPAALGAMGRRGREKAVAVFDWEAVAAAVAEVYRAAVAAAPR